jgi:acyl carrier protein
MSASIDYVRRVLSSVVGPDRTARISDDLPFFERGVIDSLQIVEIIGFLEDDLDLEVEGEDLTPQNFGSIAGLARFLVAKGAVPS